MKKNESRERVLEGLRKRAEGLEAEERVIEYTLDEEGNRRAVREKTQIKYYPPDVAAAKACLELESQDDFSDYTDEELLKEKERLLGELMALRELKKEKEGASGGRKRSAPKAGSSTVRSDEGKAAAEKGTSPKKTARKSSAKKTAAKKPAAKKPAAKKPSVKKADR